MGTESAIRLGLIVCLLGGGCIGCNGPIAELYPVGSGEAGKVLFVFNNHWHTGFVLRYDDIPAPRQKLFHRFKDKPFVEVGWGDEAFYRSRDETTGQACGAMFFSQSTALHLVAVEPDVPGFYDKYFGELYRIRLSEKGYARVVEFIADSFQTDRDGQPVEIEQGLYGDSWFYRGRGSYHMLHTCNNWLADGLRAGGFPITPVYAATAWNVGYQIRTCGGKYQKDIVCRKG